MQKILNDDESPPFDLINADGQGKVIILADYASNRIPRSMKSLGLSNSTLDSQIAWDRGSALIARALSILLDAPLFLPNYSRLVIDCNRSPGSAESIAQVSNGISIPGNRKLGSDQVSSRNQEIFEPYHAAISNLIAEREGQITALITIHSYSSIHNKKFLPWKMGIGYGRDKRLSTLLFKELEKEKLYSIGDNMPYTIEENLDYSILHHTSASNLPHAMLQFRNDALTSIDAALYWALAINNAFSEIFADLSDSISK